MICITGIGWVTPGGIGSGQNHRGLPSLKGELPAIARKEVFDKPFMRYGRLDLYSKVGMTAAALALKDAGFFDWTQKRNIGIVASTITGCLKTDADYYDTVIVEDGHLSSPNLFAYTLPNSFIGETALYFGLTGSNFIIQEDPLTGLEPLRCAILSIIGDDSEIMLAGICDTGCTEIFGSGYDFPVGSIFVVLEKERETIVRSYGYLTEDNHRISFRNKLVENISELASICISSTDLSK